MNTEDRTQTFWRDLPMGSKMPTPGEEIDLAQFGITANGKAFISEATSSWVKEGFTPIITVKIEVIPAIESL